ncbi:hypothetical protein ES708_06002 [subsurface metagenome]
MATSVKNVHESASLPQNFYLHQSYPNPFNSVTLIPYDVRQQSEVSLNIYTITGQLIKTVARGSHAPGRYNARWNGTDANGNAVSSGLYILRMNALDFVQSKKILYLR